jgi:long-chain acyl-CoA synthetase
MQTLCHLSILLNEQAKVYGNREAFVYQDFGDKEWKSVSWNEASYQVQRVSNAMLNLGIKVQEKIAIFSQNSLQYVYTDFGAWGIRVCTVPFYANSSEEQIQFMVNDANIRFIFAGEQEQYDKARRMFAVCPSLEKVIVFSRKVRISSHDPVSIYFDDFIKLGEGLPRQTEVEELYKRACNDDLMSILYTSGTTGSSKGVMLSHGQALAAIEANYKTLPITPEDRILNFLPYTHIFEKGWSLLCVSAGCTLIILNNPREVQGAIRETNPTCMCSVPRFWEKVYAAVQAQIDNAGPLKKKIFNHALEVGHKHNVEYLSRGKRPPLSLVLEYKFINKTIFSLIRKEMGLLKPNFFPTAGAAVSPEVEEFIHSIGIFMMVGYGLTESFATASNDHKDAPYTIGSIGRPLVGLSVRISDEGEILLKGPTITKGYYNRPDLNANAFTCDGYFRTGDVGYLKNGELYITERIKDLFKTSNGKYIAPQMIESKILVDKFIETITVIADERKFVSALIVPVYDLLEKWARNAGIPFADREELCRNPQVNAMLKERVDTLQQTLANYEKIKRFTLLPHHFSVEKGEMTNTMKIKRNVVAKRYKHIIDAMYKD